MATRDLTPQDEDGSNKPFVPDENGEGVQGQSGDPKLDDPEQRDEAANEDK